MDQQLKTLPNGSKPRHSRIFEREGFEHYVEPHWTSRRLFAVEEFDRSQPVLDPCAGFGRIPESARAAGYRVLAADIADRGYPGCEVGDFLDRRCAPPNVVTNPPFNGAAAIARHAFEIGAHRVAMLFPLARMPAARWAGALPLRRVWMLSPRPPMPPGSYITAGLKPGGGRVDFAWLVFERGYRGHPELTWLRRDGGAQ